MGKFGGDCERVASILTLQALADADDESTGEFYRGHLLILPQRGDMARLRVAKLGEDIPHVADAKGVDRSRADWFTPKIEIDLNGPYGMRMVWIKSDRGLKVRTSADNLTLSEAVRLTGYIQERLDGWEREILRSFPADALGLAVPYDAALGEKATHILLYADGECIGHLPATGTYEERIAEAQRVYREIEASWAMVTPKYPRSPWSADSAESPWTPDTPESAE